MAHQVETMAYAGETPWHGLGTRVSNDLSVDEMLEQSGLDWKVRAIPVVGKADGIEIKSSSSLSQFIILAPNSSFPLFEK